MFVARKLWKTTDLRSSVPLSGLKKKFTKLILQYNVYRDKLIKMESSAQTTAPPNTLVEV